MDGEIGEQKDNPTSVNGKFPLQPDQCITYYAKIDWNEDLCESMVAYLYDPDLLKETSVGKFNILSKHDIKGIPTDINVREVPKDEIKLPEIKPETVYYYIEENAHKAPDFRIISSE